MGILILLDEITDSRKTNRSNAGLGWLKNYQAHETKEKNVTIWLAAELADFDRSTYPKHQLRMNEGLREGKIARQKTG